MAPLFRGEAIEARREARSLGGLEKQAGIFFRTKVTKDGHVSNVVKLLCC